MKDERRKLKVIKKTAILFVFRLRLCNFATKVAKKELRLGFKTQRKRKREQNRQEHSERGRVARFGRCDSVLDVPRLRLRAGARGAAARDVVDVDAAVVSVRRAGAGLPRPALATDAGAVGRGVAGLGARA